MAQPICWVLIHSLWQGMLLALAAGLVVGCTKRSAPALRYRWLCGLSILYLSGLATTLVHELATAPAAGDLTPSATTEAGWLVDYCNAHAFAIVMIWLGLAALKSLRLAAGWNYIQRIRREARGAAALWVDQVQRLSRQLGVRQVVKVVESGLARVPMVIGQFKPVIIIPLGLINHLPPGEMEAVLLHELAHVRRWDYVVNLVQRVAECLLFFNPAVLWVSTLIREERENCCDDLAVAQTGDKVELIRALVRFKEHSLGSLALAFPGNRRQLLHRVLRLSRDRNKSLNPGERFFLAGGLLGLLWLLSMSAGGPVRIADKGPEAAQIVRLPRQELALLESRQRVTENMEWVEAQLLSLRREKAARRTNGSKLSGTAMGVSPDEAKGRRSAVDGEVATALREREMQLRQAREALVTVAMERQQQVLQTKIAEQAEQAEQERQVKNMQLVEQERQEKNMRLVERKRQEQNMQLVEQQRQVKNMEQAEQGRVQAEQERLEAWNNQLKADQARQQVGRQREEAERQRVQAERARQEAESDRVQADRNRLLAEQARQQAIRYQNSAAHDPRMASLNRDQDALARDHETLARDQETLTRKQQTLIREEAAVDRQTLLRQKAAVDRQQTLINRQKAARDAEKASMDADKAALDRQPQ